MTEQQPSSKASHQAWEGYFHRCQCKQFLLSRIVNALIIFFFHYALLQAYAEYLQARQVLKDNIRNLTGLIHNFTEFFAACR